MPGGERTWGSGGGGARGVVEAMENRPRNDKRKENEESNIWIKKGKRKKNVLERQ